MTKKPSDQITTFPRSLLAVRLPQVTNALVLSGPLYRIRPPTHVIFHIITRRLLSAVLPCCLFMISVLGEPEESLGLNPWTDIPLPQYVGAYLFSYTAFIQAC
ncbi:hypothetical protein HYPSUDRAFT_963336 [Hypholoma sublateritium FD-334 SS-4]|uniref:Uncharacterized protein n=1 Tax=Hypholoma sublateritium (strain FD-334 SS-4) TaxID=945553 RepID=A0A0D2NH30_HYPSF|nr:hypothetical protein HYPSUDRAFT_963336 [Hypholoma sublateritium FD-334 SS-4]